MTDGAGISAGPHQVGSVQHRMRTPLAADTARRGAVAADCPYTLEVHTITGDIVSAETLADPFHTTRVWVPRGLRSACSAWWEVLRGQFGWRVEVGVNTEEGWHSGQLYTDITRAGRGEHRAMRDRLVVIENMLSESGLQAYRPAPDSKDLDWGMLVQHLRTEVGEALRGTPVTDLTEATRRARGGDPPTTRQGYA